MKQYSFLIESKIKGKLTLAIDKDLLEKAEEYAQNRELSLTFLIENYLKTISSRKDNINLEITPFVKSMSIGSAISAVLDNL